MKKTKKMILTIAVLTAFIAASCNETPKQVSPENPTETVENIPDEIVRDTSTDKDGKILEMAFNNTKDIVVLTFNGETIELVGQKPASGIWYKNDHYELRGQGDDVELTKDGKVVFKHESGDKATTDETEGKTTKEKQTAATWWVGKRFENNRPVSKNPEEGGPDFLIINQDKTASYKVGDMVDVMSWKENGTAITFKNKMTGKEIVFKIGDSFLTDSFGTKWTVKK